MDKFPNEVTPLDKKNANKSIIPFLVMVIIGGICAILCLVFFILSVSTFMKDNILRQASAPDVPEIFFVYNTLAIVFLLIATGLLGAGIPLLIVTNIKKNKAKNKIEMLSNKPNSPTVDITFKDE